MMRISYLFDAPHLAQWSFHVALKNNKTIHSPFATGKQDMRLIFYSVAFAFLAAFTFPMKSGESGQLTSGVKTDTLRIYLSFDDGPGTESRLIDSISLNDSTKITVFLVGQNVLFGELGTKWLELYKLNPFIEIGNHSFSHAGKKYKVFYSNAARVVNDVILNADTLRFKNKMVRLPGRNAWRIDHRKRNDLEDARAASDSLSGLGYTLMGWDLEWGYDSLQNCYYSAEQMIASVDKMARCKSSFTPHHIVILCHDPMLRDEDFKTELLSFIRIMKARDPNIFEHLGNYPGNKGIADFFQ